MRRVCAVIVAGVVAVVVIGVAVIAVVISAVGVIDNVVKISYNTL